MTGIGRHRRLAIIAGVAGVVTLGSFGKPALGVAAQAREGVEKIEAATIRPERYLGWPNTYRLSNGIIEAHVVTAVGPRIIDLRMTGGDNLFYARQMEAGKSGEATWMFRGGWRLWIAPERKETTYALDNSACEVVTENSSTLRVTAPAQPGAGIQKQIEVTLVPGAPGLRLTSKIRNVSDRPVKYAPWSLSVMRPEGRAFVPFDVGPLTAFDDTRRLLLWSYASFADPRYHFGDRLIRVDHGKVEPARAGQSGRRDDESKIGVDSKQGWAAYLLDETLYLKRFPHDPSGTYPDGGATIEVYSSAEFLELEHLGPLTTIGPGEEIVFPEDWWLFRDVRVSTDEAKALAELQRYLQRAPFP